MTKVILVVLSLVSAASIAGPERATTRVPMRDKGASTYYVDIKMPGLGKHAFLVDTGAGYMTINEAMLAVLREGEQAIYIKDLEGTLADGSHMIVPVYRIKQINIGGTCRLRNVEAAVFPGKTRGLLGLSVLRRTAPVNISMKPPTLRLSHCLTEPASRSSRGDKVGYNQ